MDIKEYINSGVVEMYAMHALNPQEKAEFEQKLLLYPELKKELQKVQESLDDYSESHASNPRPELRAKILQSIESKKQKAKVLPIRENNSLTYKYLIAACLAALVVSTFASWFFYSRWNEAEDRYSALLNDKNQLAKNYNLVKNEYDRNVNDLIIMRDQQSTVIQLFSTDTTKNFEARIYWNKNSHESYIDVLALPIPDEGKQYQLWALVGGKPIDAGVFEITLSGIQRVKDIPAADAWAVTLEPKGGSVSPTLDQMYLLGIR
ncbi:MAG: anti-sigma factor [Bacteroidetes bacterium]|nr:anti-sigma factor [Bacteroidota bacterium]